MLNQLGGLNGLQNMMKQMGAQRRWADHTFEVMDGNL
jgi:hypothetical protein